MLENHRLGDITNFGFLHQSRLTVMRTHVHGTVAHCAAERKADSTFSYLQSIWNKWEIGNLPNYTCAKNYQNKEVRESYLYCKNKTLQFFLRVNTPHLYELLATVNYINTNTI